MSEVVATAQQGLTGKYHPYPEYKDSGVEWLGEVPSHWGVLPCRAGVTHLVAKNTDGKEDNYLSLMANIGIVLYEDKGDVGNKKPDDLTKCKIVRKGNLVINSMNYAIGSYGMSPYDGICSPVYIILDANTDVVEQRYALRLFENKPFQKHLAILGNGILEHRAAIGWDDIKGQYIPFPSLPEQHTIAAFLDYETARIDRLITQQQRLIELLKEKRQAVISHAVTKGLNPDVPMKDSGVEWLGQVPKHWVVCKIKNLAAVISKGTTPSTIGAEFIDEGVRFLKAENIGKSNIVSIDPEFFISEDVDRQISRSQLKENDVLVIIAGATTGFASVLQKELLPANTNQAVSFIRLLEPLHSKWVLYWLSTTPVQKTIWMGAVQAAQPNLSMENLGNIPIVIPPINEIAAHLKYIENKIVNFDNLAEKAGMAIQLMQERRTALISAAVTGKIDLRGWTQPAEEVAA